MSNWAEKNGIVINPGKTKALILSCKTFIGPVQDITMDDRGSSQSFGRNGGQQTQLKQAHWQHYQAIQNKS